MGEALRGLGPRGLPVWRSSTHRTSYLVEICCNALCALSCGCTESLRTSVPLCTLGPVQLAFSMHFFRFCFRNHLAFPSRSSRQQSLNYALSRPPTIRSVWPGWPCQEAAASARVDLWVTGTHKLSHHERVSTPDLVWRNITNHDL